MLANNRIQLPKKYYIESDETKKKEKPPLTHLYIANMQLAKINNNIGGLIIYKENNTSCLKQSLFYHKDAIKWLEKNKKIHDIRCLLPYYNMASIYNKLGKKPEAI